MLWKNHKEKIVFILFVLQITLFYKLIQIFFSTGRIFSVPFVDENIPFIALFVIPYLLLIPVMLLPFALVFRNRKKFVALSFTFFFASTLCNIIYMLFQTTIIRPEIIPVSVFDKLVVFVYSIDKPLNLFPSGHVMLSSLANLCLLKINKRIAYIIFPLTVLIILSTLFIKQHHTPDVFGGLLVAFLSYQLFKKREGKLFWI